MELINKKFLLFGQSIDIPNFGTVYPPKIKEFLDFDYAKFKMVFSIRKDLYIDNTSEDYDKIKDFDLLIILNMIEPLIHSLKILYKTDDVKIEGDTIETIRIVINANDDTYYLNRDNYTEFADMILIILHEGKNVADKEVKKELNEIELKMERKRKEFERKKALKEAENKKKEEPITIFDLANYIIHMDSKYDYQSILELTVYQLINSFNLYQRKENYRYFMDYKTSGNFKIEDDINHWFFGK